MGSEGGGLAAPDPRERTWGEMDTSGERSHGYDALRTWIWVRIPAPLRKNYETLASYFISLCLSLLIYKMGLKTVSPSRVT